MLFVDDKTERLIRADPSEKANPLNYPVGVTTYENFFHQQELFDIEKLVEETETKCEERAFLPMTAQ